MGIKQVAFIFYKKSLDLSHFKTHHDFFKFITQKMSLANTFSFEIEHAWKSPQKIILKSYVRGQNGYAILVLFHIYPTALKTESLTHLSFFNPTATYLSLRSSGWFPQLFKKKSSFARALESYLLSRDVNVSYQVTSYVIILRAPQRLQHYQF